MSVAELVLGVLMLVLAAFFVFGRELILARARSEGRPAQPTALVMLGVIFALLGVVQLVLAAR